MISKKIEEKYGPQSSGDNIFTRKARLLQSVYRLENIENTCGIGPNKNSSHRLTLKPTYYGNIIVNGETSGKNFFYSQTFEYAKKRVREKKPEETIDEYRLFNNLLSSMPMAFNLFHPLMMLKDEYPDVLNKIIKELFPQLPIHHVVSIEIEFIPTPLSKYTDDKSAMDAAILFTDKEENKYIIAIETKYTDALGQNKAKENDLKHKAAILSGLFSEEGINHIATGCTQIYRNFLLVEKYRMVENLKDSYSIILAPKDHPSTDKEIESILDFLIPAAHYKLAKHTLEDFVEIIKTNCPEKYQIWINSFYGRYLNFSKLDTLNSASVV